jgi:hypothetical protein
MVDCRHVSTTAHRSHSTDHVASASEQVGCGARLPLGTTLPTGATPDADIDQLAATSACLLTEWPPQRGRQKEAAPWSGAASAETTELKSAPPSVPTSSSIAAAHLSLGVRP